MFTRMSNSWQLVKASFAVLRSDKELILFPIVSFVGMIIASVVFFIPFAAAGLVDSLGGSDGRGVLGYVVLGLFYVVIYSITIFANSALIGAALIRLDGGDPTLSDGFRIASERAGKIVGYALIAATVGVLLRAISERSGIVGRIVIGIVGFAWNMATFLVVPVLVTEDVGPIDAVRRSGELLKRTWGEQIVGNFSIGGIFGLLAFGVMLLIGIPLFALIGSSGSPAMILLAVLIIVILMLGIGLVSSTLSGIYQAALYRYATGGEVGDFFDPELIQGAFKPKRKRGF